MTIPSSKGKALVTGASTGIGSIYARKLAERGYDLLLVARSGDKLAEVAQKIHAETTRSVDFIVADLASTDDVKIVAERLSTDSEITALVNNAGIAEAKPLLASDADYLDQMIRLNVTALTRLSLAAATAFVSRGKGLIINIGSILSLAPESFNGVYSGTKAYVQNFTLSLRQELQDKGVSIQLVMPGATSTPIWEKVGVQVNHLPAEIVMDPEEMVDAALTGLDLQEFITIPSLPEMADFDAYEKARLALRPNLSRKTPADRYAAPPSK